MFHTVPTETIIAMAVIACLSVIITAGTLIFFKKKTKGDIIAVITGAVTFIVFAYILESVLHNIVLAVIGKDAFYNVWFYAIYGGLAAALFEETGRVITMKLMMKKTLSKQNSIMFGIGHGGAEFIMLAGVTYISNIVISLMINAGIFEASLEGMDEVVIAQTADQLSALWTTPTYQFLLVPVERIAAFALQICLSYLVYRAVKYKKPMFYVLAFMIHFVVDSGVVLLSKAVPVYVTEIVLAVAVICLTVVIYRVYKSEPDPIPSVAAEVITESESGIETVYDESETQ